MNGAESKARAGPMIGKAPSASGRKRRSAAPGKTRPCLLDDELLAARVGNCEWLDHCLRSKVDEDDDGRLGPSSFDENGLASIHLAASGGHLSCIKLLVEKYQVDVNLESKSGLTALHLSCSSENRDDAYDCLVYLLRNGANPSATDEEGNMPMHLVAREGNIRCLQELLNANASVLCVNEKGQKPFHFAQTYGHRAAANLLRNSEWHEKSQRNCQSARNQEKLRLQQAMSDALKRPHLEDLCSKYNDQAFRKWLEKHNLAGRQDSALQIQRQASSLHCRSGDNSAKNARRKSLMPVHKVEMSSVDDGSFPANKGQTGKEPTNRNSVTSAKGKSRLIWDYSTKTPDLIYVSNLKDQFPRDPYPALPYFNAKRRDDPPSVCLAKAELENQSIQQFCNADDLTYAELKSLADSLSVPGSSSNDAVFRCKNILDMQKRRSCSCDSQLKPEIGLHLSNDVKSTFFQQGLFPKTAFQFSQDPGNRSLQEYPCCNDYSLNMGRKQASIGGSVAAISNCCNIHMF